MNSPCFPNATHVSIHVPARGTIFLPAFLLPGCPCFNPRSRTGNDSFLLCHFFRLLCFNPRSRTGNDGSPYIAFSRHPVSIHVPARGTMIKSFHDLQDSKFQSTFPHGERLSRSDTSSRSSRVSIHVPARGTITAPYRPGRATSCFNPRSRTGNDSVPCCPR